MIALWNDSPSNCRPKRLRPRVVALPPDPVAQAEEELARLIAEQRARQRAVLLSGFVPGLGQLYLGHTAAGLTMLGVGIVMWVFSLARFPDSSFLPLAIIHLSAAVHAGGISPRPPTGASFPVS